MARNHGSRVGTAPGVLCSAAAAARHQAGRSARVRMRLPFIAIGLLSLGGVAHAQPPALREQAFTVKRAGEAVASITAGCAGCDWAIEGREAAVLSISVDGTYSQHLLLTRGAAPAEYRVMLGAVATGTHHLRIERDAGRSARGAAPDPPKD